MDYVRTVIARSVSDEAISVINLTLRLRRSLWSLAMTIVGVIRCNICFELSRTSALNPI
jgi:hypothetical protein